MYRSLCILCIVLFGFSTASAQEIEIFIPGEQDEMQDLSPSDSVESSMAQCFAAANATSCESVNLNSSDSELESFVGGSVSLETFVVHVDPDYDAKTDSAAGQSGKTTQTGNAGYVDPAPKTVKLTAVGIHIEFDFDSDKVRADQISKLDIIGAALKDQVNSPFKFAVLGHTDGVGSEYYNCDLSDRRAHRVVHELLSRGVPITLVPIGVGEELHKVQQYPESGENRRVSFVKFGDYQVQGTREFQSHCE